MQKHLSHNIRINDSFIQITEFVTFDWKLRYYKISEECYRTFNYEDRKINMPDLRD